VLAALAACLPERSLDEIAGLPVGDCDALLLALHAATFGPHLDGLSRCQKCGEAVEFALPVAALPEPVEPRFGPPAFQLLDAGAWKVEYRLPDSRDLAAAAAAATVADARALLAGRCVRSATGPDGATVEGSLPEGVLSALAAEIAARQPWADIEVALACPACSASWSVPLNLATFVWDEIAAEARRLVHEVDRLARTYGWRETDILAMTPARRRTYLAEIG
jgi:hypothetical protein